MSRSTTELFDSVSGPFHNDAGIKTALVKLAAEVKDRRVRADADSFDYFAKICRAISRIKGNANLQLRMSCVWECAIFFETNGYFADARQTSRLLTALGSLAKNKAWIGKGCMLEAMTLAELGDVGEALVIYEKSLANVREADPGYELAVLINIGVSLMYAGLYRDAIACFSRVAELAPIQGPADSLEIAQSNLAQCHYFVGEYARGYDVILKCQADGATPANARTARSFAIREWISVLIALELGKLDEARQHSVACRHYAKWANNPRVLVLSNITEGLCEVHCGDSTKGLRLLEDTLSTTSEAAIREDVLRALVRAYETAGLPERALEHMHALLAQLRRAGEKILDALVSTQSIDTSMAGAGPDLSQLRYHEATLRAQVAEREVLNTRFEMLERLSVAADLKEESSGEHGYRVGALSALVAKDLGWTADACHALEVAGRLHDIGKIGIPDRILLTSQELKDAERHFVSAHAVIGAELLAKSNVAQLRMAEEVARYHHEWWDGSGYPSKLSGRQIPLHARIVALADVFDALTHGRPYQSAWPAERALALISEGRGRQFEPELADRFLNVVDGLRAREKDIDTYLAKAAANSTFLQARKNIRRVLSMESENVRREAALVAPS